MPAAAPLPRTLIVILVACAMSLSLVATLSSPVRAAAFAVNSTADQPDATPGDGICASAAAAPNCTLRAAVGEANALAGADIITVPAGTYILASGALMTTESVTITGPAGAATTIIDGDGLERVFELWTTGAPPAPTVNISGLTVRDGSVDDTDGGAIRVGAGTLNLANSVVTGSTALPSVNDSHGGGIFLAAGTSATLSGTTVSGNEAEYGAGIFVSPGASLALNSSSLVTDNGTGASPAWSGGGIYNNGGTVTVSGSTVSGNHALEGGGMSNPSGSMTLDGGSFVIGNSAIASTPDNGHGAGIWNYGVLSVTDSTISDNAADSNGGGIYTGMFAESAMGITGSTITGNIADNGGGIYHRFQGGEGVEITGSTIGGAAVADANDARSDGGGIWSNGEISLGTTTVSGNTAAGDGGGMFVDDNGDATITGSTVGTPESPNTAADIGGGIYVDDDASAVLSGTTVSGNEAPYGAGIYVGDGGSLALNASSSVSGHGSADEPAQRGGGINNSGDVTVTGSSVAGNYAHEGGGIYNTSDGTLTVTGGSVISGNFAIESDGYGDGAGIYNTGLLTVTNSTISGNTADADGGGIYNPVALGETITGSVIITNSTISGNTADGDGGGIYNRNVVDIVNSTISGNSASVSPDNDEFDGRGGGIWSSGDVDLEFVTVALNTAVRAGGIWVADGDVHLFASIVANNTGTGPEPDANCFGDDGDLDSDGSNLDSDDSCELDPALNDQPGTDPMLGGLANNGGPTQTHALLTGSEAIDAVEPPVLIEAGVMRLALASVQVPCPATADQRGESRPQDGDENDVAICDIGAFELVPIPPAASVSDVTVIEGDTGTTVSATFTVTLSRAFGSQVTMSYATADGTATAPADYLSKTGALTFAPGDTSETITITVVGDDVDELNETFVVNLSAPVNATLADAQGTGNIIDDEGPIVPLVPTPTPTPAAGQLPDTGTADTPLNGWGAPGLAIAITVFSASVLIRNRRRQAAGAR